MKKFLIICTIIFIIISTDIAKFISTEINISDSYFTKVVDKDIYIAKNNRWEKFYIKGINLNQTKPGVFESENDISYEEYLRWIGLIYDIGANCIRVSNLMGDNFYKALNDFNKEKDNPIYLMQGIYFDESYLKEGDDPQSVDLQSIFKNNIKLIIDSVHGNPYNVNKLDVTQVYDTDISKYIIGYTIGIEFALNDLIYTEIMNERESYNGKYFYTEKNSSSFEAYLAEMGDYLAQYEMKRYKSQRLISFIGSIEDVIRGSDNSDINVNEIVYYEDSKKYIDIENIKAKKNLKTGLIATYNIFPSYLEIEENDNDNGLKSYLDKINIHHNIPVLIGELAIPSSRVPNKFDINNKIESINEEKQANLLLKAFNTIKESNCAGEFIFEFQDNWSRSSWNTKGSKILDRSVYWSDPQTYAQSFGVMAFDPGKEKSVSYPDDSIDEWDIDSIVTKDENFSLHIKSDEKYLYFMVKAKDKFDFNNNELYIDLDITPKSGSEKSSQFDLNFETPVDFIINIKNKENSRVYVHEYYNEYTFNKNMLENKMRPDLIANTKNMDEFSKILIKLSNRQYVESLGNFIDETSYETGKLIYGNGNPNSDKFNSLSDFYMGDNYVEIRIPWALLNFMDPSTKAIKDDFYEKFKITEMHIDNIKVGCTIKENGVVVNRLKSEKYDLNSWIKPNYHERLKKVYYILQEELNKE